MNLNIRPPPNQATKSEIRNIVINLKVTRNE
nr:MAG TPA: hypothetical protein [Caudoviricetes sp.]